MLFSTPRLDAFVDSRVHRARAIARDAHDSLQQRREYLDLPYWTHAEAVAERYLSFAQEENEERIRVYLAAALCHDVLERVTPWAPKFSRLLLHRELGAEVANLVDDLSNRYTMGLYPGLDRGTRKRLEAERLAHVADGAKTIKLADIIENALETKAHDPESWPSYRDEKRLCLEGLQCPCPGNFGLYRLATRCVCE